MQRQIINGVPYYVDSSKKIYTYTDEPSIIGNLTDGLVTINPLAHQSLDAKLAEWRNAQSARTRKPASAANTNTKANS
jgi:hypothetical protein